MQRLRRCEWSANLEEGRGAALQLACQVIRGAACAMVQTRLCQAAGKLLRRWACASRLWHVLAAWSGAPRRPTWCCEVLRVEHADELRGQGLALRRGRQLPQRQPPQHLRVCMFNSWSNSDRQASVLQNASVALSSVQRSAGQPAGQH